MSHFDFIRIIGSENLDIDTKIIFQLILVKMVYDFPDFPSNFSGHFGLYSKILVFGDKLYFY